MTDLCPQSDLPRDQCAHCGAHPGNRIHIESAPRRAGKKHRRDLFAASETPPPTDGDQPLKLGKAGPGTCPCGQPTRDTATGCDDCAGELSRLFGDVPWLTEQLETTITRQRGKRPGASARANDGLPWDLRAATTLKALQDYLLGVTTTCLTDHVRHQSPDTTNPRRTPTSMSAWLLWRVDGLQHHDTFPDVLKRGLALETRILKVIDRGPDLLYLGICQLVAEDDTEPCGGAIYAKADEILGKCRVCNAKYDAATSRTILANKLDDMLCTAAEIAHLATYLGLDVDRRRIQLIVAQWHKRKRITPAPSNDPAADPRFRYGDVALLLAKTYAKPA